MVTRRLMNFLAFFFAALVLLSTVSCSSEAEKSEEESPKSEDSKKDRKKSDDQKPAATPSPVDAYSFKFTSDGFMKIGDAYYTENRQHKIKWTLPKLEGKPIPVRFAFSKTDLENAEANLGSEFIPTTPLALGEHTLYIQWFSQENGWSSASKFKFEVVPTATEIEAQWIDGFEITSHKEVQDFAKNYVSASWSVSRFVQETLCAVSTSTSLSNKIGEVTPCRSGEKISFTYTIGDLYLIISAKDIFGRTIERQVSRKFSVDLVPPTITSVVAPAFSATTSIFISVFFADTASQMCVSLNADVTSCTWQAMVSPVALELASSQGSQSIYVWLKDVHGNISTPYTATTVFDTEAPDAPTALRSETHPLATVSRQQSFIGTFDASVSADIFHYKCELLDGDYTNPDHETDGFPDKSFFSCTPSSVAIFLQQGGNLPQQVTLSVRAIDNAGNSSAPAYYPFKFDVIKPAKGILTVTNLLFDEYIRGLKIEFEYTLASDVASFCVAYNKGTCDDVSWRSVDSPLSSVMATTFGQGQFIALGVRDSAGNEDYTYSKSLHIADEEMAIHLTSTTHGSYSAKSTTFDVEWVAGNLANITNYQCRLNSDTWSSCSTNSSAHYESLLDGNHVFSVRALRNDSSYSRESSFYFSVDTTAPQISNFSLKSINNHVAKNLAYTYQSNETVGERCLYLAGVATPRCTFAATFNLSDLEGLDVPLEKVVLKDALGNSAEVALGRTVSLRTVLPTSYYLSSTYCGNVRSYQTGSFWDPVGYYYSKVNIRFQPTDLSVIDQSVISEMNFFADGVKSISYNRTFPVTLTDKLGYSSTFTSEEKLGVNAYSAAVLGYYANLNIYHNSQSVVWDPSSLARDACEAYGSPRANIGYNFKVIR